jgi:hypothetical protein
MAKRAKVPDWLKQQKEEFKQGYNDGRQTAMCLSTEQRYLIMGVGIVFILIVVMLL